MYLCTLIKTTAKLDPEKISIRVTIGYITNESEGITNGSVTNWSEAKGIEGQAINEIAVPKDRDQKFKT